MYYPGITPFLIEISRFFSQVIVGLEPRHLHPHPGFRDSEFYRILRGVENYSFRKLKSQIFQHINFLFKYNLNSEREFRLKLFSKFNTKWDKKQWNIFWFLPCSKEYALLNIRDKYLKNSIFQWNIHILCCSILFFLFLFFSFLLLSSFYFFFLFSRFSFLFIVMMMMISREI